MTLSLKTSDSYGYSLMPHFGVDDGILHKAQGCGVLIEQHSPGIFSITHNGSVFGVVPVKGQAISLAKAGQLGSASKAAWKYQFEQALQAATTAAASGLVGAPMFDAKADVPIPGKVQNLHEELEGESGLTTKSLEQGTNELPFLKKTPGGKVVVLSAATECLQPVYGSSPGSLYYVIAMFTGMNMALRLKGSRFSMRVEGNNLKIYKKSLEGIGFTVKPEYGSVHFETNDMSLIRKTVGAVVGMVGFGALQKIEDPEKLVGKA